MAGQRDGYGAPLPKGAIRDALVELLGRKGRTISAIEEAHGRTYRGDRSQEELRGQEVWHSKRGLDREIAGMLKLDYSLLLGPDRPNSDFAAYTTSVICSLRERKCLRDWKGGGHFGIFRVEGPLPTRKTGLSMSSDAREPEAVQAGENLPGLFMSILTRGRKDNTYKFALARALLDYCRDAGDAPSLSIKYDYIADSFLKYYWHQECRFRIRQNHRKDTPPQAVQIIREVFGDETPGDFSRLKERDISAARDLFCKKIFGHARSKTSLVIPKFQNIRTGNTTNATNAFYEYSDDEKVLVLKPRAFEFFRGNYAILSKAVLAEWAKFLEKTNPSLPRLVTKIERFEATRGSLSAYRDLYSPHFDHCFYCNGRLKTDITHVDHLIPWSYLFDDGAWNLVLACERCNCRKSDSLPQGDFLDCLVDRNERYSDKIGKLRRSLEDLDTGKGWKAEIKNQYSGCSEYGFAVIHMP